MAQDHQRRTRRRLTATVTDLEVRRQRALVVGVVRPGDDRVEAERSLQELGLLVDTAGSDPVESQLVRRARFDPATLIGSGKAHELTATVRHVDADVVVFDNALTPAQQRNLQGAFGVDVVDREALILDIFAQHATTREGMIQVELALLRYRLPRLTGKGVELSRLGGGIGTRGPGETKLETDRRRISQRISKLEDELAAVAAARDVQRKARRRRALPQVAIIGYTNSGKSTLLNQLTNAGVLVEDRLFATLQSTIRRLQLPAGREVLLTDTVGFVRRLPHQLIEAFRSTLEETAAASLLVHMVDASSSDAEAQIATVHEVMESIGAGAIPELLVFNKVDATDPVHLARLCRLHPGNVAISALSGRGIGELLDAIDDLLARALSVHELMVPYDRGDVLAELHRTGRVLSSKHEPAGTLVAVELAPDAAGRYSSFAHGAAGGRRLI